MGKVQEKGANSRASGLFRNLMCLAFESCYANKRLAIWPTFLVWIIMVSCPLRFSDFGLILDGGYFAKKRYVVE